MEEARDGGIGDVGIGGGVEEGRDGGLGCGDWGVEEARVGGLVMGMEEARVGGLVMGGLWAWRKLGVGEPGDRGLGMEDLGDDVKAKFPLNLCTKPLCSPAMT